MLVTFYNRPVQAGVGEDGLPLFQDRVYVKIARDMTNTVDRAATEEDYERFPLAWKHYQKKSRPAELGGFPLEMWPTLTPSEVAMLKARDVFTVQQFAAIGKQNARGMPPALAEKQRLAVEYIAVAGDANAVTEKLQDLKAKLDMLTEENKQLREENAILKKAKEVA
jgi:hypothetical protein